MTTGTRPNLGGRPRSGVVRRPTAEMFAILDRLDHCKEQLAYWRTERDEFIRAAYFAGVSTKTIAEKAGVEPSSVYRIACKKDES